MPRACWGSQTRTGRSQSSLSRCTLQFRWRGPPAAKHCAVSGRFGGPVRHLFRGAATQVLPSGVRLAMRQRLLLVLSCRVFQAGKVDELGDVVRAWLVAPGDNNDGQIHLSETLWIL